MKAIILCAGYGKRLWPLTLNKPKALLLIGKKPLIDYIIENIQNIEDIEEILILTNLRFKEAFSDWLSKKNFKKSIRLIIEPTQKEEEKLGAIGSLNYLLQKEKIAQDFLLVGGDNLFDFDLRKLIFFFKQKKKPCILLYDFKEKQKVAGKYGVVLLEGEKVIDFEEKPKEPKSSLISTCCYVFTKNIPNLVEEYLKEGNDSDALGFFIAWLIKKADVLGIKSDSLWIDIGSVGELERAQKIFS